MKPETSKKIYGFSLLKILSIPLITFSLIFVESNKAAFNYISFADSIYSQLFTKIALFSYYLPDLFFMISSYLLASKLIRINTDEDNPIEIICTTFQKKIVKIYPIYLSIIIIYWGISGALHCGPVWYAYE